MSTFVLIYSLFYIYTTYSPGIVYEGSYNICDCRVCPIVQVPRILAVAVEGRAVLNAAMLCTNTTRLTALKYIYSYILSHILSCWTSVLVCLLHDYAARNATKHIVCAWTSFHCRAFCWSVCIMYAPGCHRYVTKIYLYNVSVQLASL